jgi:hydrogenase maturation factor
MSVILQLQLALWSVYALVWIVIAISVISDSVAKTIIKVCRELQTIEFKKER